MTKEEAWRRAKGYLYDALSVEEADEIIKALEQEPCEDAISRQAVLEQTYNWSKDEFLRVAMPFDYLRKRINSLPFIKQEYTDKIILTIHKTIAQFLEHENKLTDRDHFLLDVNQAICTNIRLLESEDK